MYGCEFWNINNKMSNKITAAEMWFYRRMLRISYMDRITNEDALKTLNTNYTLLNKIRKWQAKFLDTS